MPPRTHGLAPGAAGDLGSAGDGVRVSRRPAERARAEAGRARRLRLCRRHRSRRQSPAFRHLQPAPHRHAGLGHFRLQALPGHGSGRFRAGDGLRERAMAVNMDASEGTAVEESGGREVRSTVVMTGLRFGGKMLGLLKTLVIAAAFGASGALDAFWVAYMLPMLMPGLILGVVTTAFIPSFMRTAKNGAEEVDWRGLNTLFTLVTVLVFAATALVWLGRMQLVKIMAPGMSPEVHALAAQLTGTMAIAVFIFGINSILSAILQALHRFAVMSLESIITNVFIIAGAILLS